MQGNDLAQEKRNLEDLILMLIAKAENRVTLIRKSLRKVELEAIRELYDKDVRTHIATEIVGGELFKECFEETVIDSKDKRQKQKSLIIKIKVLLMLIYLFASIVTVLAVEHYNKLGLISDIAIVVPFLIGFFYSSLSQSVERRRTVTATLVVIIGALASLFLLFFFVAFESRTILYLTPYVVSLAPIIWLHLKENSVKKMSTNEYTYSKKMSLTFFIRGVLEETVLIVDNHTVLVLRDSDTSDMAVVIENDSEKAELLIKEIENRYADLEKDKTKIFSTKDSGMYIYNREECFL